LRAEDWASSRRRILYIDRQAYDVRGSVSPPAQEDSPAAIHAAQCSASKQPEILLLSVIDSPAAVGLTAGVAGGGVPLALDSNRLPDLAANTVMLGIEATSQRDAIAGSAGGGIVPIDPLSAFGIERLPQILGDPLSILRLELVDDVGRQQRVRRRRSAAAGRRQGEGVGRRDGVGGDIRLIACASGEVYQEEKDRYPAHEATSNLFGGRNPLRLGGGTRKSADGNHGAWRWRHK
jgi:hypothetical protein